MKKLLISLLIFALLAAVPVSAAEENFCGENLTWELDGNTLVIDGNGAMYDFTDGAPWDEYKSSITSVKMSGVTYVGAGAFKNYDGLTSVSFGNSLYELGAESFYDCDNLTKLTMPASFKIFGESSLRSCDKLSEIHCSGAFPSFKLNCLWDTNLTIYYSLDRPWKTETVLQLESAFQGRVQFRGADGSDPHGDPEPAKPTNPPTQPPVTPPPTETTVPSTAESVPDFTMPTEEVIVTRAPVPTAGAPEHEESAPMSGLAVAMLVLGVAALLAAGGLLMWQRQQHKKRARRRPRRKTGAPRE